MSHLQQILFNGLIAGGIYALVALGYTLVYGILKFINFAHGEVFMVGAYLTWMVNVKLGMHPVIAIIVSVILCGFLGFLIEKTAYKPLRGRNTLVFLITSIGVSFLLQGIIIAFFGADIKSFSTTITTQVYTIFGASVTNIQIIILVVAVMLMFLLHLFVKYTKTGKAIRAMTDNLEVASTIGININTVMSWVFIIGSGVAAISGALIAMDQNITPTMGVPVGIKAFTAAVVGGIGNMYGAFLGGFAIGLAENIGSWFLPSGFKDAIAFIVLIIMLLFKPHGIMGKTAEQEVKL